jgi:hypothetical protein
MFKKLVIAVLMVMLTVCIANACPDGYYPCTIGNVETCCPIKNNSNGDQSR